MPLEHIKADGQETEQGLKTCGGALYGFESLQGAEISLLYVHCLSTIVEKVSSFVKTDDAFSPTRTLLTMKYSYW